MNNKKYLTKKDLFKVLIKYFLNDKNERKEALKDVDYYINNTMFNRTLKIKRLINCLNYSYSIKQEKINNITNFLDDIWNKYTWPLYLTIENIDIY